MISLQEATLIAEKQIGLIQFPDNDSLIIIDEMIIEKPYAWIFPYTSKKYWETGDKQYVIGGNSPLFVSKTTGHISTYRSGLDIEAMFDHYEEENAIWILSLRIDQHIDIKDLLSLKDIMEWTQEELNAFKKDKKLILDMGSARRLAIIQERLAMNRIKTDLVLSNKTSGSPS